MHYIRDIYSSLKFRCSQFQLPPLSLGSTQIVRSSGVAVAALLVCATVVSFALNTGVLSNQTLVHSSEFERLRIALVESCERDNHASQSGVDVMTSDNSRASDNSQKSQQNPTQVQLKMLNDFAALSREANNSGIPGSFERCSDLDKMASLITTTTSQRPTTTTSSSIVQQSQPTSTSTTLQKASRGGARTSADQISSSDSIRAAGVSPVSVSAPSDCPTTGTAAEAELRPYTQIGFRCVSSRFPGLNILGRGAREGGGDHPAGNAIDVIINGKATGDQVAQMFISNVGLFHVKYVIWQQRIWLPYQGSWRAMSDRGSPTANHMDHVHISFDAS